MKVLENHHCSVTFKILSKKNSNILSGVSKEKYLIMRKNIISNILATDMKKHFDTLKNFDVKFQNYLQNPNLSNLLC